MKTVSLPRPAAAEVWHAIPPREVASRLEVDPTAGLDEGEAGRRRAEHGPNRLPDPPRKSALRMLVSQFANILIGLLMVAAALALAMGEMLDAGAIVAIVVMIGVLGFLQERRAAHALEALRRMAAPQARVKRGGAAAVLPAADLVPGDVVLLEGGDHVPADLRLTRAFDLRVIEASLTGESEPSEKDAAASIGESAGVADRSTMTYLGTIVAAGVGEGIVVATGARTEFGRIAQLVGAAEDEETPLQARLRVFGRWLAIGAGAVIAVMFALGLMRGLPLVDMVLTSISLAVAAVPEGLPAVVTIALALGVHRMARRHAIVRRLAAVETLGCTTVICSDKTGTLTEGRMTVVSVHPAEGSSNAEALRIAAGASTARLVERDGTPQVVGDPMEGAILEAARRAGVDLDRLEKEEPVLQLHPFDPARRRMSVVRGDRSCVKGAIEAVISECVLENEAREKLRAQSEDLSGRGLRVLAVATRIMQGKEDAEKDLTFAGLVAFQDPPRPEAHDAVAACRTAGIRPVMITGDHPRTALAIARDLGIAGSEGEVATGAQLEGWDDEALGRNVEAIAVYARVSPEHKLRIVRAWQKRGAVVAMTGDGVNDAPALKGADIGVAMGRSGTDVAKDAAAMVLTDDNFATLVAAVEQGRAIFENIRKTLLYLLSGNLAEILVMAAAILAGLPLPLLPIQLLWINLVTDGLPALALATDPSDGDLLRRPPRKPGQEIADRDFLAWMGVSSVLAATCTLGAFLYGLHVEGSLEKARTYAFSTLVIEEVLRAFALRSRTKILWELGLMTNVRLAGVAALIIALQVFSHHSGFLQDLLKTGDLTWGECAATLALAAVPVTILELWKLVRRGLRI